MKKLINAVLILLLATTLLLFTTTLFIDSTSQTASGTLVNMEIENRINAIVDEIQEVIPVQNDEAVDKLITKIQEDKHVSELVDTYAKQFVHDLASSDAHSIDMNEEVQTLLLGFSDEFEDVLGDVINPTYKEAIIREVITRVDFNDYYAQAITKFKTTMSPNQLKLVQMTNTVLENTGIYRTVALVSSIAIALILVFLNLGSMFGTKQIGVALMLSGALHLIIRWGIKGVIEGKVSQLRGVLDFTVFFSIGLTFVIVGLVLRIIGSRGE